MIMKRKVYQLMAVVLCAIIATGCAVKEGSNKSVRAKPNIIIFYVDDLGFGDLGCYGAKGVETPHIDRLADTGVRFTDAHSPAATCTPSRYSLLTGKYAFRNNASILPGDAPLLIATDKMTLPKMLQEVGYNTGVVGKWHLGLGDGTINWNGKVSPGPKEIGFDYSFLLPATGDRVPCVYMENQEVVNLDTSDSIFVSYKERVGDMPTGLSNPELLSMPADMQHSGTIVNHVSRIGFMSGGQKALWVDEDFPTMLTQKAMDFMSMSSDDEPFFLYYSFHDIHVPRIIHPDFQGKSTMGPRGDAIVQVDHCVGEVVDFLKSKGQLENTLIIFSSDNGPVLNDGYEDMAVEKLGEHNPSGVFRGGKYSVLEGGTRVPMIVSWKGHVESAVSDALMSHVDLLASIADLTGYELTEEEAADSKNYLDALLGESNSAREYMLEEAFTFGLRYKNWKYIKPKKESKWIESDKHIESGHSLTPQLYDLSTDASESENIADLQSDMMYKLDSVLNTIIEN